MKGRLIVCLLAAFVLGAAGCSSSAGGANGGSSLDGNQWRAVTTDGKVLSGIAVDGAAGVLRVVNESDATIGAPTLAIYDLNTGEPVEISLSASSEIPSGGTAGANLTFPDGAAPADSALLTLSLGNEPAAVFMTSSEYSELSPVALDPSLAAYIDPLSGEWSFEMDLGVEYLTGTNCPSAPLSMTSVGECTLIVSSSGYAATWTIDGSVIALSRSASSNAFESAAYYFEVESDEGTVYGTNGWTLTPSSSTSIAGTLAWNNNLGCSANYPIWMSHNVSSSPVIHALCEGTWNISYSSMVCGGNVISPASLPLLPYPQGTLDVTYLLEEPISLTLGSFSNYQSLPNIGGTNTYGTLLPNIVLGTTTDPAGAPLTIVGGLQLTAVSPTQMSGVLVMNGFGVTPCSGAAVVMMTSVTGC